MSDIKSSNADLEASPSALESAGKWTAAADAYRRQLSAEPNSLPALLGAARVAGRLGDLAGLADFLRRALTVDPSQTAARLDLAIGLLRLGAFEEVERECRALLQQSPAHTVAANLLGISLRRQKRFEEAEQVFWRAAEADPGETAPLVNLANMALDRGQPIKALAAFRQAREAAPNDPGALLGLGRAFADRGDYGASLAAVDQALALRPDDLNGLSARGRALFHLKKFEEAAATYDKALAIQPSDDLRISRAKAARALGRSKEAADVYQAILDRNPDHVEALMALGMIHFYDWADSRQANALLERAYALKPNHVVLAGHLIESLAASRYDREEDHIGRAAEIATAILDSGVPFLASASTIQRIFLRIADFDGVARLGDRNALRRHFIETENVSALHMEMGRVETDADRNFLVDLHRQWGEKVQAIAARKPVVRPARAPRSKIRVGIMSSDLRDHPVSYFALPIFEHYDRAKFEVYAYSFFPKAADRVQKLIESKADCFRNIIGGNDAEIAQTIASDDLDILFELGGSTQYNRLGVMAYKPSTLQASWLGYPHSAGLSAIDYILVDPYLKPSDPKLLVERPFEMSNSWVCMGAFGFPEYTIEAGLPEERRGCFTFGTMNNPNKFTRTQIALWAQAMAQVPNSRFLFVRPESAAAIFRDNIAKEFARHGISADRLEFLGNVRGRHLQHYNLIDVSLDTGPQTGGTTTCETLWMGCPVVTLIGPAFFERLSYSNLTNAGLGDLCARTPEGFVSTAVALANDLERRRALRHGLRAQIKASPLGQTEAWVRDFERNIETAVVSAR
jgi:protein O-GlcNAc transferase